MAGTVNWTGANYLADVTAFVVSAMGDALAEGVTAAAAQSRVDTGRYRDGWQAEPVTVSGDVVRGQIINEAENPSGGYYAAYVSAGTSRMAGDFAHAAALDRAGATLEAKLGSL